tara:strand:+ start:228 stop:668 length:441 start_codon:yes stop_codon:yes gene_type:complete
MKNRLIEFFNLKESDYTKDVNITDTTSMYDPLQEDGANQQDLPQYNVKVQGKRYILTFDVNKNPTKRGIKVKFFPVDKLGKIIPDPTPEQLGDLQNDIATTLAPKFNEFKLEFDEDEDAPETNVAAFQIPLSSFISFVKRDIFGEE